MILETNRLLLRPWSETDATDLFSQASHHEVGPAAGWPVHQSVEERSRQSLANQKPTPLFSKKQDR